MVALLWLSSNRPAWLGLGAGVASRSLLALLLFLFFPNLRVIDRAFSLVRDWQGLSPELPVPSNQTGGVSRRGGRLVLLAVRVPRRLPRNYGGGVPCEFALRINSSWRDWKIVRRR